jgi:trehalose/maltose hydrolase-like predicted phosphorylase
MSHAESHSPSDFDSSSVSIAEEPQLATGQIALLEPTLVRSSDPSWLLTEEGFTLSREHEIESLFAIANGYVGNRGSLAEGSPLSAPATFMAGVFEQLNAPGSVPQLMTLPDWTGVRIWINDEPLSMDRGDVLEHRRILDLHQGVFRREWCHRDPHGRITRIAAFRVASLVDRHLLLHSVTLTAENYSALVRFETCIEVPSSSVILPTTDWIPRRSSERPNVFPLALRAPGRGTIVAFGVTSQMLNSMNTAGMRKVNANERRIVERCETQAAIGAQCHLHRLISIYSSRESGHPFEDAMAHLKQVLSRGIGAATSAHLSEWLARWQATDIEVSGDNFLQRALRFAAYHLISAANPEDGRVSIGARALTGSAYKGHIFWDTEIYMLPFFILTHPPSARALLEYRYHTLDAAREKARSAGFRGAMYPWESADTGEETTPRAVIMPTGEVIQVLNGEMEVHITADIAFAMWQYWNATEDQDFLLQFGAEIMLETARFWASRGALESDGAYHIRHVIGPDEYHDNVDDNAFTNLMAAWNLRRGAETAHLLQHRWPERWNQLASRLHFNEEEVNTWQKLADAMFTGFNPQTQLFEQFSGYFNKEPVDLNAYEPRSAAMDVILGHERIQRTNIVKQADLVMAIYLLWDEVTPEARLANFRYYEPRTGHGSSLSPSIHALVAARLQDSSLAQRYLKQASEIDLGNNMGNAAGGVHAAALGGLWQAIVFGFAGVRLQADGLSFDPQLLPHWRRLAFPLQWRGRTLSVSIEPGAVRVAVKGQEPVKFNLEEGPEVIAEPGREYMTERTHSGWGSWSANR